MMSTIRFINLLLWLILLSPSLNAQDGDNVPSAVSKLQEQLSTYIAEHPQSNLYLHLDKTIYSPEETIWFKAYLLGDTSQKAKVLYVRIVDECGIERHNAQFPVYDIRAHGNIVLSKPGKSYIFGSNRRFFDPPRTLLEGNYLLYAYTDRMVAVGDTNVFVQPIRIRRSTGRRLEASAEVTETAQLEKNGKVRVKAVVRDLGSPAAGIKGEYQLIAGGKELRYGRVTTNIFGEAFLDFPYPDLPDRESLEVKLLFARGSDYAELSLTLPHRGNPLRVNCYPEGGRPVPGGRVAIEVLDIHGNPVETGIQVKDGNSLITGVHTDRLGMATVELPTATGVRRYVFRTLDGRGQQTLEVPAAVQREGYSLKVCRDSTGISAVVRNHGAVGNALLVLRSGENILWNAPLAVIPGDSATLRVPAGDFPRGILSLAVFDGDNRPWAERLFMNKEQDDYLVDISTDQQGYGTKKKVTVTVRVTDATGNPAVANLSVAATERNRRDSTAFRSIGQQAYYAGFARPLRQRLYAAGYDDMPDGLLLGRLWQYSRWGSICVYTPGSAPVYVPDRGGTTGVLVVPRQFPRLLLFEPTKLKVKAKKVELRSLRGFNLRKIDAGPVFRTMTAEVDPESGTFFVPDSLLLSRQGQEWEIKIPAISNASWRFHYLVEWQDRDIGFDSTVVRGGQLRIPKAMNSFAIIKSPTISAFDFRGMNRLEEIVIGRKGKEVKRMLKKTICEEYEDIIREDSYRFHGKHVMKLVKGWTHPWGVTPYGEPRTVMYLGCGRYRDINYIRNITIPEEFPLPDYETYPTTELDMRSTVYWNPNMVTDGDGTATFSFFTSDVTGDFEIVAQGLEVKTLATLMGTGHFKVIIK